MNGRSARPGVVPVAQYELHPEHDQATEDEAMPKSTMRRLVGDKTTHEQRDTNAS